MKFKNIYPCACRFCRRSCTVERLWLQTGRWWSRASRRCWQKPWRRTWHSWWWETSLGNSLAFVLDIISIEMLIFSHIISFSECVSGLESCLWIQMCPCILLHASLLMCARDAATQRHTVLFTYAYMDVEALTPAEGKEWVTIHGAQKSLKR